MSDKELPAFASEQWNYEHQQYLISGGMTLRDYFAAKAMQSLVAGEKWLSCSDMPLAAGLAYKMADAMLLQRGKND